MQSIGFT
jgi:hypothetical protein